MKKRLVRLSWRQPAACFVGLLLLAALAAAGDPPKHASPNEEAAEPWPLDDPMQVLAEDVASPAYRKLIDEMLLTDLLAEWQRVDTLDSAENFLKAHGGRDRVSADAELRRAYERRAEIRDQFLELMRHGFKRFNVPPPFDAGAVPERAGTHAGAGGPGAALTVVLPADGAMEHWPRFRGPTGQGNSAARGLSATWSQQQNIAWRTSLPGSGNSSPIIWGDRIFLTSSGDEGRSRALHCLDLNGGRMLWTREVPPHEVEPMVRDKNGFASATPVTDGERVVAFFGSGGLICFDFDGKPLWHHPISGFDTMWGSGASPLLYEDQVILIHDQNNAESVFIALDKHSGRLLWSHPREQAMGWSTPLVVRVGERDELIYAGRETVKGYDPRTGEELWSLAGPTIEVVPTPVVGGGLIFSASGRQGPTLALRPGGQGDVTRTHLAWRSVRGGPHVPSPVYFGGRLYTVNDTGIVTCLDAQTGELVYQSRIRDKFSASPLEAEGLLYCASESGVTYVLKAGDRFELVAKNDLGSPILASPAALDGMLYIRTADELVAIGAGEH